MTPLLVVLPQLEPYERDETMEREGFLEKRTSFPLIMYVSPEFEESNWTISYSKLIG